MVVNVAESLAGPQSGKERDGKGGVVCESAYCNVVGRSIERLYTGKHGHDSRAAVC
jgi:hypothetical protein